MRKEISRNRANTRPQMETFLKHADPRLLPIQCDLLAVASVLTQNTPIILNVDATDALRKVLHARLRISARPGPLSLVYPK